MKKKSYDIIGDVHGRFDKLEPLLKCLGYRHNGSAYTHHDPNRSAIFLGDLIDPKNDSVPNGTREVLHTVRDMVNAGAAQCILGNHEYNFVAYKTRNHNGDYIRAHDAKNIKMHAGTESAFNSHPEELENIFTPWIKTLPFSLDMEEIRAVHACWHPEALKILDGKTLGDLDFLEQSGIEGTAEYDAVEIVLKGIEVGLPEGAFFLDHTGNPRTKIRARWWETRRHPDNARNIVFPYNPDIPEIPIDPSELHALPGYAPDEKPLFIGHYFKKWVNGPCEDHVPEARNLLCLDFSAAASGPLAVYQWRFEDKGFAPENLHLVHPETPLGLISAYLSNHPAHMGDGPESWAILVNDQDEPPVFFEYLYGPIISQALELIEYRDLSVLWLGQTREGADFQRTIDNGFLPEQDEMPTYESMNGDVTNVFLFEIVEHGHNVDAARYRSIFAEDEFLEEDDFDVDPEPLGPWTLGLVENRDTADLNAEVTPMTGHQYETQEKAKNAAKGLNREAFLEEGMFADLIIVIPPES
jgi:hypothetical protein